MKPASWLTACVSLIALAAVTGCGGPKPPDEMIYYSMTQNGTPAQRDVKIVPGGEADVNVDVWELSEQKDLSKPLKKDEKPLPPTKTAKMPKADFVAMWKAFPKGFWKLHDMKNEGAPSTAPSYRIELIYPGHHLNIVVDNPEQQQDKTAWQIIQAANKAAGVQ